MVYGTGSQPTRPVRAEGKPGLPRPIQWDNHRPSITDHQRDAPKAYETSQVRWFPNDSGSPAIMAKEPLQPHTMVQCAVASTPAYTGSGLARRLVLRAPAGACCFQLDELG